MVGSGDEYGHSSESEGEAPAQLLPYGAQHHGESDGESGSESGDTGATAAGAGGDTTTEQKFKHKRLTPEQLALGAKMIYSKKAKRDIINDGWNRYMFNDEGLPAWFVKDEQKHMVKPLDVSKAEVDEVKERQTEMNVKTIKKVVEARARKKKRTDKKMEKARKKSEAILENADMTDKRRPT